MTSPRIEPQPERDWGPAVVQLIGRARSTLGTPRNVFATLAHNERLLTTWLPFAGGLLLGPGLDRRSVELLILRTAWNCRCRYEWAHHVQLGHLAGLAVGEIADIPRGPEAPSWSALDRVLLTACDELHDDRRIHGPTWADLVAVLPERELLRICMLVGQYEMLAMTLNSAAVQLEPELPALADDLERLRQLPMSHDSGPYQRRDRGC